MLTLSKVRRNAMRRLCWSSITLAISVWGTGCLSQAEAPSDPRGLAEATASLTTIPAGILCVQIRVAIPNQTTVSKNIDVMASASAVALPLGQLAAGQATFTGSAFNVACSSVTSTTVAQWIADPATTTLQPGLVTNVDLVFRRNNTVTATGNFLENVSQIAVGDFATYSLMGDGSVKQWGDSGGGGNSFLPAPVPSLAGVV